MRYRWTLLGLLTAWVAVMAIDPPSRANWVFGNIPLLVVLPFIVWSFRRLPLSDVSYTLVFLFLALHEYGTHYGYQVPWMEAGRNHYDRVIHAAFGGLLVWPVADALRRSGRADGAWAGFLAVSLLLAAAAFYEVTEWMGAVLFYDGPAERFLGHQGDALDATKDMALSLAASIVAMSGVAVGAWARRGRGAAGGAGGAGGA